MAWRRATAAVFAQSSGHCIADGEVIAYHINETYPVSEFPEAIPKIKRVPFSSEFVLVKHKLQAPQPKSEAGTTTEKTPPTLTVYSLYMHTKVHTVNGSAFFVTPGLFQRYAQELPDIAPGAEHEGEAWRWVQRQFEKLKVHRKRADGLSIWTCQVEGPRKKAKLQGDLLDQPDILSVRYPLTIHF